MTNDLSSHGTDSTTKAGVTAAFGFAPDPRGYQALPFHVRLRVARG